MIHVVEIAGSLVLRLVFSTAMYATNDTEMLLNSVSEAVLPCHDLAVRTYIACHKKETNMLKQTQHGVKMNNENKSVAKS